MYQMSPASASPSPNVSPVRRVAAPAWRAPLIAVLALVMILPVGAFAPTALAAVSAAPAAGSHPALASAAPVGTTGVGVPFADASELPSVVAERAALAENGLNVLPGAAATVSGADVHAAAGSPSNFYLTDYAYGSTVAQAGPTSQDLVAGFTSYHDITNGTRLSASLWSASFLPSEYLWQHGLALTGFSTDGGQTWTTNSPPLATAWTTPSSTTYTDLPEGEVTVSGNDSGGAVAIEQFAAFCDIFVGNPEYGTDYCNNTALNYAQPGGIAIAQSTDGGVDWSAPSVLWQAGPFQNISVDAPACGPAYGTLNGNYTVSPTIYEDPTSGDAVASWAVVSWNWSGDIVCSGGTYTVYEPSFIPVYEMASYSSDGGATWSTPVIMSDNQSAYNAFGESTVGTPTQYFAFEDFDNYSPTAGTIGIDVAQSTNGGASWSSPLGIGRVIPVRGLAYYADFPGGAQIKVAADNSPTSPYEGNVYIAYSDNRSATNGDPSIAVITSSDGGSAWSSPVYVTPNDPTLHEYDIPNIAVQSDGTVWVTFYTSNVQNGNYVEEAVVSTDGGTTWSAPFLVSDAESTPPSNSAPFFDLAGLVATPGGAYASWLDCREVACTSPTSDGDWSALGAQIDTVGFTSNVPGVTASVSALGGTTSVPLSGTTVTYLENGSSVTLEVPTDVPDNATTVYAFANFTLPDGSTSLNNPSTFTYAGAGNITANYVATPAAWIEGYVGPVVGPLAVSIAGPSGTTNVPLTVYNAATDFYTLTVPAGPSYTITVSAGVEYQTHSLGPYPTSPHVAVWANWTLVRTTGTISGTIAVPPGADLSKVDLQIGNAPIGVNAATGTFSDTLTWGLYWVNASLTGYTPYSQAWNVTPNGALDLQISLGGGYLNGSVNAPNAIVSINNVPVTLTDGSFATVQAGGTYLVTAEAPTYSFFQQTFTVVPGQQILVLITLRNRGWITGSVTPTTAEVLVNHASQSVESGGVFNATVPGATAIPIEVFQAGYQTYFTNVSATPGNVTALKAITLTELTPGCTGASCQKTTPSGNNNSGSGSSNTTLYVLVGLLLAVVVVLAVVLVMRRRPPTTTSNAQDAGAPATDTYDGSSPGNLPRMQPDGSMQPSQPYDEGSPPQ